MKLECMCAQCFLLNVLVFDHCVVFFAFVSNPFREQHRMFNIISSSNPSHLFINVDLCQVQTHIELCVIQFIFVWNFILSMTPLKPPLKLKNFFFFFKLCTLEPLDANMQTFSSSLFASPKFTFIGLHVCTPLFYFETQSSTSKKGKVNLCPSNLITSINHEKNRPSELKWKKKGKNCGWELNRVYQD